MKRIESLLRIGAYCAIIGIAVLAAYNTLWSRLPIAESSSRPNRIGEKLRLNSDALRALPFTGSSLIFVLSSDCKYCTQNAPFLKDLLVATKSANPSVVSIGVLPQPLDVAKSYIEKEMHLVLDEIAVASPTVLGVRGTPSVIALNANQEIVGEWVGLIPPELKSATIEEILTSLRSAK